MAFKLLMVVVSILDLIAFGLTVAAEQRRSTMNISTGYGLGAFFLLLASQIIIMVANRCFCCGKALNPTGSRACAVILFIFCWLSFGNKVCFSAKRVGRLALWESNEKGKEEWRWIDNVPGHGDGLYRGFLFDARLDASP